jgi:hypothetical protein
VLWIDFVKFANLELDLWFGACFVSDFGEKEKFLGEMVILVFK